MSVTLPAKVGILVVLLCVLAVIVQHQYGTPGMRIVDRLHAKPLILDFDSLDRNATPASIRESYRDFDLTCISDESAMGDYVCWAPVSQFLSVNARTIAFFFRYGTLSGVRIAFSAENHPPIFSLLNKRYGSTHQFGRNRDVYGNNIVGWMRPNGFIAINDNVGPNQEAILLWTTTAEVFMGAFGIKV